MNLNLPPQTRLIDLIRLANTNGKRLVWRSQAHPTADHRPTQEKAANDQQPVVTHLRPRLRVVDGHQK